MEDYITMGDANRLDFVFNHRIKELEKLAKENPDLEDMINIKISEYRKTLEKYRTVEENNENK